MEEICANINHYEDTLRVHPFHSQIINQTINLLLTPDF